MPHVIVKMYPGRTEAQKQDLAEQITKALIATINCPESAVSIGIEEIAQEEWAEKVYRPDIIAKEDQLYKKPGYKI